MGDAGGNATMLVGRRSRFRLGGRNDGLGARRRRECYDVGGQALWIPARGPE